MYQLERGHSYSAGGRLCLAGGTGNTGYLLAGTPARLYPKEMPHNLRLGDDRREVLQTTFDTVTQVWEGFDQARESEPELTASTAALLAETLPEEGMVPTDALGQAQSKLSFHLKVLKEAGLLLDRQEGRWIHYRLNASAFQDLESWLCALTRLCKTTGQSCSLSQESAPTRDSVSVDALAS